MTITYQGRKYTSDGRARLKICSGAPKDATAANGFKLDSDGRIYARVKADNGPLKGSNTGVEGFRFDASGALLIATAGSTDYKHNGFAFRKDGAVYVTSNNPSGQAWQGLGRDSNGYLCVEGLAAAWDLTSSLTGITGDSFTCTRGSTATYFGPDGLLRTAAIDEPRFDCDPATGDRRGLLIEEQRTNLCLHSENFSNGIWTKTSASIIENAVTAPDGNTAADSLVATSGAPTQHSVLQSVTRSASNNVCASVFAKAGAYSFLGIRVDDGGSNALAAVFNLSTGTISTNAVTNGTGPALLHQSITPVGNGWYRCVLASQTGAGTTARMINYVMDANGNPYTYTFSGNDSAGCYIWGAQIEIGSYPTSYIPTTSATVTRSADVVQDLTISNYFTTQGAGSIIVGWERLVDGTGNACGICSLDDGTTNNRIDIRRQSTTEVWSIITESGSQGATIIASATDGNRRAALAFDTNDAALSVGGTLTTDSSLNLPVVDRLSIGRLQGSNNLGGWVKFIALYNKRLSNAELVGLST